MNKKETDIFKYLMEMYKHQWDLNQYNRTNYDEDIEHYVGYRDHGKYPLAYNESFNRILPIVNSILSRFMDQLYQTGNIVSIKPRKRKDLENAKAIEAVLNYQLESLNDIDMQGGSYLTIMKWFFNTITFGKGIAKAYWKIEERISPKRIALPVPNFDRMGNFQGMDVIEHVSQEMQAVYDGPYVEILHNKTFVPHPHYRSIQKMPGVFLVYKKSMDYVRKMYKKGFYKNLNEIGWHSAGGAGIEPRDTNEQFCKSLGIEGALSIEEIENKLRAPDIDIIEAYTKLILESAPYEVGSGIKIKGEEEEVVAHIGNYKTLLSVQKNVYGIRPIFDMGCYMHPELYWDIGMVRLTKGIQEQVNNLANLRMQNVMLMVNQMLRVDPDSDIIEPIQIPDFHSNLFMEQEQFYDATIQDLMGFYDYNMGRTPQRQERVGVVYGIQAMGEARAKLMLMSMDYLGLRPLLKYLMILNTFHLPSGFEYRISDRDNHSFGQIFGQDIHPDFDYAARYTAMEPALGKQFRAQQLVQMAAMWAQNPWINQYQFNKTMMELMDIREADYLLKQPEQFMKEIESQAQQQMMAEQAKQRFETEGKLVVSQQDFQEESALAEQEFGHNLALEALKLEAVNEKSAE